MPKSLTDVSETDHRNRFRVGKCGRHRRSPESIERQRETSRATWADPEKRRAQSKLITAVMARPGMSEKISERTAAALANPVVKERQRAGVKAAWADPAKREAQAALTRERMAAWRAERLQAAEKVLRQLPRGERGAAMAALASAAGMGHQS
jgi:hypothetical protein